MEDNYTIVNCHKNKIAYKNSRILAYQFSDNVFWNFNNQVAIHTDKKATQSMNQIKPIEY